MNRLCKRNVNASLFHSQAETHTKRQATQHGCLPSLLGDGDKGIKIVYGEEKIFGTGRLEQLRLNRNLLYRYGKPNEPTKEGPLTFVLFESPFTSVSIVSRATPF